MTYLKKRYFAMGDIHGCCFEFEALLEKIAFNPEIDELWLCGDLVNRGPDSLALMRILMALPKRPKVVLGNHDLHFLAVASNCIASASKDTLDLVLSAPDCDEICTWLKQCHLMYSDPMLGFSIVHAGILPAWTIFEAQHYADEVMQVIRSEDQAQLFFKSMYGEAPQCWEADLSGIERMRFITNSFTRMRFCSDNATYVLEPNTHSKQHSVALQPWFKIPGRKTADDNIIFGHWAALEGNTNQKNVFALDRGCVWGNYLQAMCLETLHRYEVPANRLYVVG